MKLERQHMCSPPEQMKTSLWKAKMIKYVPLQFQGAVLHLLNIYFYKTNLGEISDSETRRGLCEQKTAEWMSFSRKIRFEILGK